MIPYEKLIQKPEYWIEILENMLFRLKKESENLDFELKILKQKIDEKDKNINE